MWDEITYPFLNFNGCTVGVYEWISNVIPHFKGHVITYQRLESDRLHVTPSILSGASNRLSCDSIFFIEPATMMKEAWYSQVCTQCHSCLIIVMFNLFILGYEEEDIQIRLHYVGISSRIFHLSLNQLCDLMSLTHPSMVEQKRALPQLSAASSIFTAYLRLVLGQMFASLTFCRYTIFHQCPNIDGVLNKLNEPMCQPGLHDVAYPQVISRYKTRPLLHPVPRIWYI